MEPGQLRQLLQAALRRGNAKACLKLLARPEATAAALGSQEQRAELLHMAVERGLADVVAAMLQRQAGGFSANAEREGLSALEAAVEQGASTAVISALLSAGADVNRQDEATGLTLLHRAVRRGDLQLLRALLAAGADPTLQDFGHDAENYFELPALTAIWLGDWAAAEALLEAMGWEAVNSVTAFGHSPLSVALGAGHLQMAEKLIERGADVNQAVPEGVEGYCLGENKSSIGVRLLAGTLLEIACAAPTNSAQAVELLLRHGADPSAHKFDDENEDEFNAGAPKTWSPLMSTACRILCPAAGALLHWAAGQPRPAAALQAMGWLEAVSLAAISMRPKYGDGGVSEADLRCLLGQLLAAGAAAGIRLSAAEAAGIHHDVAAEVADAYVHPVLAIGRALLLASFGIYSDVQGLQAAKPGAAPGFDYASLLVLAGRPERWSPALHRHHPPAFRRAVRLLLLAAGRAGGQGYWHLLPADVVLRIVGLCGADIAAWLPPEEEA